MKRAEAEAIAVRLGVPSGYWQAEIEGFKVRALRAERASPRHLYATQWRPVEVLPSSMADPKFLLLGRLRHQPRLQRESSWAGILKLAARLLAPWSAVVVAAALCRGRCELRALFALELVFALVQQQGQKTVQQPCPMWLLTAAVNTSAPRSSHAGSWGMARSARAEALLPLRCFDASATLTLTGSTSLVIEPESVLWSEVCLVARLRSSHETMDGLVRLHFHARGAIANLFLEPMAPLPTSTDHATPSDLVLQNSSINSEVHFWVHAVGLNFRDVLNVLGEYPGDPGPPGGDTSGVVCEAGSTSGRVVGDPVFGLGHAPLARLARAATELIARKPKTLSHEQASTLPVTWSTTHAALERSSLQAGQHLVIQAVAGGVGLKALGYAQWLCAGVVGTAGGRHKHQQLRCLEVWSLCSSRDARSFMCGAAHLACGRRSDVVLNSLSIDFIAASFALLVDHGSFAEIGKRGVWAQQRRAAAVLDVRYGAIALDADMINDPNWMHEVLALLSARAKMSTVESLPLRSFDMEREFELAFRTLQSGLNTGKIVVRVAPHFTVLSGVQLITGGTSGLGLLTGRWLVQRGARALILASRSGLMQNLPGGALAEWEALQEQSSLTLVERCDAAEVHQIRWMVQLPWGPSPEGLWHAAGVLADGLLTKLYWHALRFVYAPKAQGVWTLQCASAMVPMKACVLFSSVAGLFGFAGQANYAGANACLDAHATCRRTHGQISASVQWGAWAEMGMASRGEASKRMASMEASSGIGRVQLAQGLKALDVALDSRSTAAVAVVPVVWSRLLGGGAEVPAFLSAFAPRSADANDAAREMEDTSSRVGGVSLEAVLQLVKRTAGGSVTADAPLMEAGVDSLGAVELRSQLQSAAGTGVTLPSTLVFDHPTARQLAAVLLPARVDESAPQVTTSPLSASMFATRNIGIVGRSSQLPGGGVGSTAAETQVPRRSVDAIGEVPTARWNSDVWSTLLPWNVACRVRHGGFVQGSELVDHELFGCSAAEAVAMDPQQRLLLEHGYTALHTSGCDRNLLRGSLTGVFLGIVSAEFGQLLASSPSGGSVYAATGSGLSIASGRLSYVLGLHGPCVSYDTACSAALSACHGGLRALQHGECPTAVLQGVFLMLTPAIGTNFAIAGMTSPLGRSHTFDARADGYARGEACGAVMMQCDPDADVAALYSRGSAVRQDGRSASLTAPNGKAQDGLLVAALADAHTHANHLTLSEAHGTGTALGDPIEVSSFGSAVLAARSLLESTEPLPLGGVKANIGHAEPAAGMTGFLKLAVGLEAYEGVPNAQLRTLNPHVTNTMSGDRLLFPHQLVTLLPRTLQVGGVSSFGYSGTIVHAMLSKPDKHKSTTPLPLHSLALRRCIFPWREVLSHSLNSSCSLRIFSSHWVDATPGIEDSQSSAWLFVHCSDEAPAQTSHAASSRKAVQAVAVLLTHNV